MGGEVTVTDEGGKVEQGARTDGGFRGSELANEQVEGMTQVLMETVRESDLQNEICDGQLSEEGQSSVVSGQSSDLNGADGIWGTVAGGDWRANGTRSVPTTGSGDCGAAAEGDGRPDDGLGFGSNAADKTLAVAAAGDGIADCTRSVSATGSGDCAEGSGGEVGLGVQKKSDFAQWPRTRPGQREFLFGRRPRDSGRSFVRTGT